MTKDQENQEEKKKLLLVNSGGRSSRVDQTLPGKHQSPLHLELD